KRRGRSGFPPAASVPGHCPFRRQREHHVAFPRGILPAYRSELRRSPAPGESTMIQGGFSQGTRSTAPAMARSVHGLAIALFVNRRGIQGSSALLPALSSAMQTILSRIIRLRRAPLPADPYLRLGLQYFGRTQLGNGPI